MSGKAEDAKVSRQGEGESFELLVEALAEKMAEEFLCEREPFERYCLRLRLGQFKDKAKYERAIIDGYRALLEELAKGEER